MTTAQVAAASAAADNAGLSSCFRYVVVTPVVSWGLLDTLDRAYEQFKPFTARFMLSRPACPTWSGEQATVVWCCPAPGC